MYDSELYHHGVKGMKWGVRKKEPRKSMRTRTFERLAESGERRARQQDALYEMSGNEYNKKSGDQWRREAAANRKEAEKSYRFDVYKATTPKKQQRELKKKQKAYDKQLAELKRDPKWAAEVQQNLKATTKKWNERLHKEGLAGSEEIFRATLNDPVKSAKYTEYRQQCAKELGKIYTDSLIERLGKRPDFE